MHDSSTIRGPRWLAHPGKAFIEVLAALAAAAAGAPSRWISEAMRARRMAAIRREIRGMSDHLLRDIGLHRSQIDQMFR